MKTSYTIAELDALLNACASFTAQHQQYFMTGNIAGREGVNADIDSVRRMMDWVADTDKGLLEYSGLGKDECPLLPARTRCSADVEQRRLQDVFS